MSLIIYSTQFGNDIESLFFVDHPKVDVCEYQKQEAEAYQCYLIIPEPVHAGLEPPGLQLLCTIDTILETERWKTANTNLNLPMPSFNDGKRFVNIYWVWADTNVYGCYAGQSNRFYMG